MASARLELTGLEELKAAMRALPADLTDDATTILQETAEDAASQLRQVYPVGDTGNLRKGVRVTSRHGTFTMSFIVISAAPHAHLWEFGTQNRVTRKGWKRGLVHPHEGLVAIAQRNRKRMYLRLMDLVRTTGAEVSGAF